MNPLRGKTALITGGSTELAGDVSLALAQQGVNISLCGRSADMLNIAATKINAAGGKVITHAVELESLEKAEDAVSKTRSAFEALDILILISPFWSGGFIHEHHVKSWDLVMNANLREPFLMSRAVLPLMREQKRGEIMALGSDSALGNYPMDGAFSVAMHGLTALMDLIRAENSEFGIRTHVLSPGLALSSPFDADGKPNLRTTDVADWVIWLLSRPDHLRGNSPILI